MLNIVLHRGLTLERWQALPLERRLLNIASELSRAKNAMKLSDTAEASRSFERTLELVDMTVESLMHESSQGLVRELLRFREMIAGFYIAPQKNHQEFLSLFRCFLDLTPGTHNLNLEIE